jgi:NAD-dependent dihydropyrimidine dehydrogenase PreA subunit
MKRNIIKIDQDKCNGCGLCVTACHEGSIALVNGKAVLLREDYCDGLGDCLPVCPTGAISMEEREAPAYDAAAVQQHQEPQPCPTALPCGCPGTAARAIHREAAASETQPAVPAAAASQLRQWPVQIKLVPVRAPYFDQAHLLIAADCSAYAYGNFHHDFIKNRITLIGCPKLDEGDYSEKLTAILAENDIKSLTVVRMEVPCCGGLEKAAVAALKNSGKMIPWQVVTISSDGRILE